ncbi:MAG: FlgD immunoglobulin-like domain containing protein, partial [Bacteroidota bacterium]
DNELKLYGGDILTKDEVEKIYFGAIREALDELATKIGRAPILMFDPASNGGYWMAYYNDVITMHRMAGYNPGTHRDKFDSFGTWGIDKPVGQFSFNMGNLDAGSSSYGVTMFLNQRNRAQGVNSYMRQAYAHPNNIAVHFYKYNTGPGKPLWASHSVVSMTDALDYWFADYVGDIGNDIYRIHMGEDTTITSSTFDEKEQFQILKSYPNPFNRSVNIQFEISEKEHVVVNIYSMNGNLVTTMVNSTIKPGKHNVWWWGTDDSGNKVPSGIYFVKFQSIKSYDVLKLIYTK